MGTRSQMLSLLLQAFVSLCLIQYLSAEQEVGEHGQVANGKHFSFVTESKVAERQSLTGITANENIDINWSHLRGSTYDGQLSKLIDIKALLKFGPTTLWKKQIGQGYSGFAVVDDRIYTQAQTSAGQFVICLDLKSGKELWRSIYEWPWSMDSEWPGPFGTPTYSDGWIYFTGCYGSSGCMNAEDGSIKWKRNPVKEFEGEGISFGYACSPLVVSNKFYLPVGGENASVVALDVSDGSVVWKSGSYHAGYTPCFPLTVSGRLQIVSLLQNDIVAHDPTTGVELWHQELSAGYDPHPAWPLYKEPYLYCAFPFRRGSKVWRLSYANGSASITPVWNSKVLSNDIFSGVIADNFVYAFDIHDGQSNDDTDGEFKCVELSSGREMWSTNSTGHSSVLTDGKYLLIVNESGSLIIVEVSPERYTELSRVDILHGELTWTQPSIYGDYLLVRSQKHIACVYLADPSNLQPAILEEERTGVFSALFSWIDQFRGQVFWMPTFAQECSWFLVSLLVALVLPATFVLMCRYSGKKQWGVYVVAALIGSLVGGPIISSLTGVFIFTLPGALYVLFLATLIMGAMAVESNSKADVWRTRFMLLFFVGICAGYYLFCRHSFIVVGWGFLVGFLPSYPFTSSAAVIISKSGFCKKASLRLLLGYTVYFWSSVLFYAWRAHIL